MKKLTCTLAFARSTDFIPADFLAPYSKGYIDRTYLPVIVEDYEPKFEKLGCDGTEFTIYTKSISVDKFDIVDFNGITVYVKECYEL